MALTHEVQHVVMDRGLDNAHCSIQTSSLMAVTVERMSREVFVTVSAICCCLILGSGNMWGRRGCTLSPEVSLFRLWSWCDRVVWATCQSSSSARMLRALSWVMGILAFGPIGVPHQQPLWCSQQLVQAQEPSWAERPISISETGWQTLLRDFHMNWSQTYLITGRICLQHQANT